MPQMNPIEHSNAEHNGPRNRTQLINGTKGPHRTLRRPVPAASSRPPPPEGEAPAEPWQITDSVRPQKNPPQTKTHRHTNLYAPRNRDTSGKVSTRRTISSRGKFFSSSIVIAPSALNRPLFVRRSVRK